MTITLAHYVGLLPQRCSLTYGELPCHAQLDFADGGDPELVGLNTEYGTRGAGLSGAADSNKGTGSFWFRSGDLGGNITIFAGTTTVGGTTTRFRIRLVGNQLRITAANTGGTTILDIRSSALEEDNLYHVMFSFDLSNTGRRHLYVDGGDDLNVTTYTNSTIDYTLADWSIGALPNGTEGTVNDSLLLGQFWFEDGVYIDLSDEANRNLFRTSEGRPVDLGSNGENPTGSSPLVYLPRTSGDWEINDGTGGGFNINNDGNAFDNDFSTGNIKCYNSLGTCQDIENFDPTDSPILWFGEDVNIEPRTSVLGDRPIFPFIKSIDFQSAIVSLGDNIGQRGSITVTMQDAPSGDLPTSLFDKYYSERPWTPFQLEFGTFWGRFKARNPYIRFAPLYLLTVRRDSNGDDEGSIESRTYLIESMSGPNSSGEVTFTAKDTLKVADGDFAKAPVQSPGFLATDINTTDTSVNISPSGSIDEYPNDGYACIGGNEIVSYTKTGGDGVSFSRAELGTVASEHSAQDRFQLVLRYDPQSPNLILSDLLINYAGIDGDLIDEDAWAAEVAAYLGTVYSLTITEPTSVADLVSEIIQQIGAAIWWDDVSAQLRLQILKSVSTDAEEWTPDVIVNKTFQVADQEAKRITEVSVYFGQLNPTLKVDETRNYASVATVTDDATEALVGGKSIKTIFARGIAGGGRTVAERLAEKYLSRYVQPPRKFNFELMKYADQHPVLGGGYRLSGSLSGLENNSGPKSGPGISAIWPQDAIGNRATIDIQITRLNPVGSTFQVEAEEMLFSSVGGSGSGGSVDPTNHTIIFDVNRNNVNLEEVHDSIYAVAQSGDTVNCYINGGVTIGSSSTSDPAFVVGSFAGGVTVNIFINGRIQGKGGDGDGFPSSGGKPGGTALYTRQNINLENNSQIWGGGGGGGMSNGPVGGDKFSNSGGGGAGTQPGSAGNPYTSGIAFQNKANNGTTEAGGTAPFSPVGGNGGGPGLAGQNSTGGSFLQTNGGAAGAAVDGNSFITYTANNDMRGPTIN